MAHLRLLSATDTAPFSAPVFEAACQLFAFQKLSQPKLETLNAFRRLLSTPVQLLKAGRALPQPCASSKLALELVRGLESLSST